VNTDHARSTDKGALPGGTSRAVITLGDEQSAAGEVPMTAVGETLLAANSGGAVRSGEVLRSTPVAVTLAVAFVCLWFGLTLLFDAYAAVAAGSLSPPAWCDIRRPRSPTTPRRGFAAVDSRRGCVDSGIPGRSA
jgi:hypothetical protein